MRVNRIEPTFVHEVPRELEAGKLYISMTYCTAIHLCCCGCGNEVVTSLHPTRWQLTYDGTAVTLHPSIGSWSLPCRSHYFIIANKVRWAQVWSDEKIDNARARDRAAIDSYFDQPRTEMADATDRLASSHTRGRSGLAMRLWKRVTRRGTR